MLALYIILGIIAAIVLIFSIKISAELIYDETFSFAVKVLFLKFTIYPENPNKKKKPKKEKKKDETPKDDTPKPPTAQQSSAPKKENFIKKFCRNQGFDGVVEFLRDVMNALGTAAGDIFVRAFVIEKLFLQMYVAKGDAAQTAIAYGKTCAAVFPALGYICEKMKVRKYDADISVDYLAASSTAMLALTVSTRPIRLTNAVVVLGFRLLKAFIKAKIREHKKKKQQPQQDNNAAAAQKNSAKTNENINTNTTKREGNKQ